VNRIYRKGGGKARGGAKVGSRLTLFLTNTLYVEGKGRERRPRVKGAM